MLFIIYNTLDFRVQFYPNLENIQKLNFTYIYIHITQLKFLTQIFNI